MADMFTKKHRSRIMGRITSKNTQPEKRVRSSLHRLGLRFRLHHAGLPGKPDIGLARWRTVIYVHGCFWHGHDCKRGSANRRPKSNAEYWNPKIEGNMKRDAEHLASVREQGWRPIVIWDCETTNADNLEALLSLRFQESTPAEDSFTSNTPRCGHVPRGDKAAEETPKTSSRTAAAPQPERGQRHKG